MTDVGKAYIEYLLSQCEDDDDEPAEDISVHAARRRREMVEFFNTVNGAPSEEERLFQTRFINSELSLAESIGYIGRYEALVKQFQ